MDEFSPFLADAFQLVQQDLYGHLDEAEFLATKLQDWSDEDVDTARELIPHLVIVIRGLLIEHEPQPSGECQTCLSACPCPVMTAVHSLLKDPENQFCKLLRRVRFGTPDDRQPAQ
ncbi:MAG: hypothetical protein ACRDTF_11495 [Pseudonocardiaceae bacterium]